jgi:periplasmic copper chaperone A
MLLILLNSKGNIEIKDAWIRPASNGMNTAMYFEIFNNGQTADTLYLAKSGLAEKVELHETFKKDDMIGMRKTNFVVVNPNSSFKFQPGGNHVMFIGLKKRLKIGNIASAALYFKKTGIIKIKAIVKK